MRLVLALLLSAGPALAQPGLSGVWYRDDDQSDDAEAAIEAAVAGYVEKVSRGRSSAADVDPRLLQELQRVMDTFVQYAEELAIEQSARDLVIDDGGARLRIYYLDGKKHERQMRDGTRLETTATVVGSQIDVYMKTEHGAKIYERYTVSSARGPMVLTSRLEDKQLKAPLVIKNVYVRAE